MIYTEKSLTCSDCKQQFTYTVAEQEYYGSKGFDYEPLRCPECRSTLFERRREAGVKPRWSRRSS